MIATINTSYISQSHSTHAVRDGMHRELRSNAVLGEERERETGRERENDNFIGNT